jgi:hypothetical protein
MGETTGGSCLEEISGIQFLFSLCAFVEIKYVETPITVNITNILI